MDSKSITRKLLSGAAAAAIALAISAPACFAGSVESYDACVKMGHLGHEIARARDKQIDEAAVLNMVQRSFSTDAVRALMRHEVETIYASSLTPQQTEAILVESCDQQIEGDR